MQSPKDRLARISLLDRSFGLLADEELARLLERLGDDDRKAMARAVAAGHAGHLHTGHDHADHEHADHDHAGHDHDGDHAGHDHDDHDDHDDHAGHDHGEHGDRPAPAVEPATVEPVDAELVTAVRTLASKGRMNGNLERIAGTLTLTCLADCIEVLGDRADLPSDDDLTGVLPGLVERHGLGATRLMLAAAAAGDAPAADVIVRLLKHDALVGLPPATPVTFAPSRPAAEDPERAAIRERRKEDRRKKQVEQAARREQAARARRPGR